jgi:hypothetical protein
MIFPTHAPLASHVAPASGGHGGGDGLAHATPGFAARTQFPAASHVPFCCRQSSTPLGPTTTTTEHAPPTFVGVYVHAPVWVSQKPARQSSDAHSLLVTPGSQKPDRHAPPAQPGPPHGVKFGRALQLVLLWETMQESVQASPKIGLMPAPF